MRGNCGTVDPPPPWRLMMTDPTPGGSRPAHAGATDLGSPGQPYRRRITDRSQGPDEDVTATLAELARFATRGVTGCVAAGVTLVREGHPTTVASHGQQALTVDEAQYRAGNGPCLVAVRDAHPVIVADFAADRRWASVAEQAVRAGIRSSLSLPLRNGEAVIGGLNLYSDTPQAFGDEPRQVAEMLARQTSLTLHYLDLLVTERASRQAEHRAAEALQRSLLPAIPALPGVLCAARYQPSGLDAQIGGDWYDAFELPGGAIAIAIGDVMGHDLSAAAAMGQLRAVLRSCAHQGSSPAAVLDRLDHLVQRFEMAQLATAIYARLVTDTAGALMVFANAGHLPPLLLGPDGVVRPLLGGSSQLIGAPLTNTPARSEAAVALPAGSVLALYTDGLVEHRHRDVSDGIAQLSAILTTHRPGDDLEQLCDRVLAGMLGPDQDDDVALLLLALPLPGYTTFSAAPVVS